MEINVRDDRKIVEIWLNNTEKQNMDIRKGLKPIFAKYAAGKYLVAVFESGDEDLYRNTRELLRYNRRRLAEMEIQREKRDGNAEHFAM